MKKFTILLMFLGLFGCATSYLHTVERTTQKLEVSLSVKDAYALAYKTALENSWVITSSEIEVNGFSAKTPVLWQRWDDDVNLFVEATPTGSVITVKSKLGHKPNVQFIEGYLKSIKDRAGN